MCISNLRLQSPGPTRPGTSLLRSVFMPDERRPPVANRPAQNVEAELEITPGGTQGQGSTIVIKGCPPDLHQDPQRIHQLLDLLNMPKGTEVRVLTTAASVIVR
jgi:hypothetical protein